MIIGLEKKYLNNLFVVCSTKMKGRGNQKRQHSEKSFQIRPRGLIQRRRPLPRDLTSLSASPMGKTCVAGGPTPEYPAIGCDYIPAPEAGLSAGFPGLGLTRLRRHRALPTLLTCSSRKTTMRAPKKIQSSQLILFVQYCSINEEEHVEFAICPRQVPMDMDARF